MIYVKAGGDSDRFEGHRCPGTHAGFVTMTSRQAPRPGEQEEDQCQYNRVQPMIRTIQFKIRELAMFVLIYLASSVNIGENNSVWSSYQDFITGFRRQGW